MKKLIIWFILLVICISSVYAVCTVTLDQESYTEGELATATIICDDATEKAKSYVLNWTNGTTPPTEEYQLEADNGTTPSTIGQPFFETYIMPIGYIATYGSELNVTLYGTNLEGTDGATITTSAPTQLIIENFNITSDYYIGQYGAISFYVRNETSGYNISNSACIINVINGNNLPILATESFILSQGTGKVMASVFLDQDAFEYGKQYRWEIDCTCYETNSTIGQCYKNDGNAVSFRTGYTTYPFTILDLVQKLNWTKDFDDSTLPGLWAENEYGKRVMIEANPSLLTQDDINFNGYNNTIDGQAFLTSGEKFRVCSVYNNSFSDTVNIYIDEFSFIQFEGTDIKPFKIDKSLMDEKMEIMDLPIKSSLDTGTNYTKCSNWMIVPSNTKGQNKYKFQYALHVDGYDQKILVDSDKFTIFGERSNLSYIDFLTIDHVNFTYANVTEGESIQLNITITNNHPTKDIEAVLHIEFDANQGGDRRKIRPIPYDLDNWEQQEEGIFEYFRRFDPGETDVILSPRFKVPYGLIDQNDFDVIRADFLIHILGDVHEETRWTQFYNGTEPTIDVIYHNVAVDGLTTNISNTEVPSCEGIVVTSTYNNSISDTNTIKEEDEHYVIRGCFEDTSDDIYIHCLDFEVQPDQGELQTLNFTTQLPYVGTEKVESEIDVWIYEFDEDNLDKECFHCGDLIYAFSGDEDDAVFNITPNLNTSCRYSQVYATSDDDAMYLQWNQSFSLQDISSKTGTFRLSASCDPNVELGHNLHCTIYAQVEDDQVMNKEVDFTCYIQDNETRYSSTNFNQMVTRSIVHIDKEFYVPGELDEETEYTLYCEAGYYNFGSRVDDFYTTFRTQKKSSMAAKAAILDRLIEEGPVDAMRNIINDVREDISNSSTPVFGVYMGLLITCCIIAYRHYNTKPKEEEEEDEDEEEDLQEV